MLILASASPRRAELLRAAGFHSFAVRAADLDESLLPGEAPREYVLRLSSEKAVPLEERASAGTAMSTAGSPEEGGGNGRDPSGRAASGRGRRGASGSGRRGS